MAMTRVVEAIYCNGHFEPLKSVPLANQEWVTLIVQRHEPNQTAPGEAASKTPTNSTPEGVVTLANNGCVPGNGDTGWPAMEPNDAARQAILDELFSDIDRANLQLRLRLPTRDEMHERR